MTFQVLRGDCRAVMRELAPNSVDAIVTDPPYHLTSGNAAVDWSKFPETSGRGGPKGPTNSSGRGHKTGFMGKQWDGGDIAFRPELWAEVLRVLKPGGHLLSFAATRCGHRMACAIEDAGFEIRDTLGWTFGSGFPKSHDVSKAIDRAAGAEREVVGTREYADGHVENSGESMGYGGCDPAADTRIITAPATDAARQWDGWGTALKPAWEMIYLARKPISEATVAANVLRWGTGAINVGACRVEGAFESGWSKAPGTKSIGGIMNVTDQQREAKPDSTSGRFPANLIHDGSDEVLAAFPETTSNGQVEPYKQGAASVYGKFDENKLKLPRETNSGSAARFFYCAKSSARDRNHGLPEGERSTHPTVKPTALMRYLCRLVTPPGGTVLDPFAGSGSTGRGALLEGFGFIGIEQDETYADIADKRIAAVAA